MVMAAKVAGSATPLTSRLPKIDTSSPRVLEKAPPATARRHAKGSSSGLTTRQQRRPSPRHVKQAERQLWKADVKRWADNVGYDVSWGWDKREERELAEWFRSIDIDRSGSVEEDEIRALMTAMGIPCTDAQIGRMFAAIGKPVDASLSKMDFVRFMLANADMLAGSSFAGAGGGLFDSNTRLAMVAYRRQRLIEDIREPGKRRNFMSFESFNDAYGQTLGISQEEESEAPPPPPHRMSALAVTERAGASHHQRMMPRLLNPSPRAPSSQLAPNSGGVALPSIRARTPAWDGPNAFASPTRQA